MAQRLIASIIVGLAGLAEAAGGQVFTFRKVADTSTLIPGGGGTFQGPFAFRSAVLDGERVAFIGVDSLGKTGVYLREPGAFSEIADVDSTFPGSAETFANFLSLDLEGASVAFVATGDQGGEGVFLGDRTSLVTVADHTTMRPVAPGLFSSFGRVAFDGSLLFSGGSMSFALPWHQEGIFERVDGAIERRISNDVLVPGLGSFSSFGYIDRSSGGYAFSIPVPAATVETALYKEIDGQVVSVANTSTAIPGGVGAFKDFRAMDFDGDRLAFVATGDAGQQGAYVEDAGLRRVADTATQVPGTDVAFLSFANRVAFSDGSTAFTATYPGPGFGTFAEIDGRLVKVLARGDLLDGKVVQTTLVEENGFQGDQMALVVRFADGTEGVYVATAVGGCQTTDEALCLTAGRFQVTASWQEPGGGGGEARALPLTDDTGAFYFRRAANIEILVKVLDACGPFDRFWVFAAGLTNLEVEIRVEDTATGESRTYANPPGVPFAPVQDTQAFATCL